MDKIWDRNPLKSEVIGRYGGDEKRMTMQKRQKSNAKKNTHALFQCNMKGYSTSMVDSHEYSHASHYIRPLPFVLQWLVQPLVKEWV